MSGIHEFRIRGDQIIAEVGAAQFLVRKIVVGQDIARAVAQDPCVARVPERIVIDLVVDRPGQMQKDSRRWCGPRRSVIDDVVMDNEVVRSVVEINSWSPSDRTSGSVWSGSLDIVNDVVGDLGALSISSPTVYRA